MLIKAGVYIDRLKRPMRRALNIIEEHYPDFVITSTYEGNHSAGSLHYADLAIDIRKITYYKRRISVDLLRGELGRDFDVVDEADHIHIEYDPKG